MAKNWRERESETERKNVTMEVKASVRNVGEKWEIRMGGGGGGGGGGVGGVKKSNPR